MTIHLGGVPAGSILYIPFQTFDANGASVTLTGLAVTDIEIYKDGSTTQRASDNGYALLDTDGIDFDGITGIHGFSVDLADNSTASFYAVGSQYWVIVSAVTIAGQTVSFIAATFRIVAAESVAGKPKVDVDAFGGSAGTFSGGRPEVNTTHAAGTAWGSGAITAASIATDAITAAKIADAAIDAATFATGAITAAAIAADAIGASELAADAATEIGTAVWATAARTLTANTNFNDLSAAGVRAALGFASANFDTQIAAVQSDTDNIQTRIPAALVSGRMDSSVGAVAAGAIDAAAIADGAIDRATFAADTGLQSIRSGTAQAGASATITLDASASATNNFYTGCLIYLTGGTGAGQVKLIISYTGSTKVATVPNFGWTVTPDNTTTFAIIPVGPSHIVGVATAGAFNSTEWGAGGVYAAVLGSSAISSAKFAAGAIDAAAIATDAFGALELAAGAASEIAAAVWDLDATAHQTQGTFGQAIGDPGADTDTLWGLANTNLDAAVSSRLATAGYTAPLNAAGVRTAVGLGSANLDTQLDALPTNTELATALAAADDAVLAAIAALSIPTANQNADALLDRADAIEVALTLRKSLRLLTAVLGGKVSGAGTGIETFRNAVADDKNRVVATVDDAGDRSGIVLDLT